MVTETGLKLRTSISRAKTLRATAGAGEGRSAGDMIVVNDTVGVVVEDAPENSDFVLVYEAEKILAPKASGETLSPGDRVYFDESAGVVTPQSTDNVACGRALEAAAASDETALIDLMVLD